MPKKRNISIWIPVIISIIVSLTGITTAFIGKMDFDDKGKALQEQVVKKDVQHDKALNLLLPEVFKIKDDVADLATQQAEFERKMYKLILDRKVVQVFPEEDDYDDETLFYDDEFDDEFDETMEDEVIIMVAPKKSPKMKGHKVKVNVQIMQFEFDKMEEVF